MKKIAIVMACAAMAGCKPAPSAAEAAYYATVDAQLNAIERQSRGWMIEPWPEVTAGAKAHAAAWAKRRKTAPIWNCLNPRWAGKDQPCGEDPVFCADVKTKAPAVGYEWSPEDRRCVHL